MPRDYTAVHPHQECEEFQMLLQPLQHSTPALSLQTFFFCVTSLVSFCASHLHVLIWHLHAFGSVSLSHWPTSTYCIFSDCFFVLLSFFPSTADRKKTLYSKGKPLLNCFWDSLINMPRLTTNFPSSWYGFPSSLHCRCDLPGPTLECLYIYL